jgi:hypothetical protein
MGMYDVISFETSEWGVDSEKEYQTKSLKRYLNKYVVDGVGALFELNQPGDIERFKVHTDYTGEIRFCDSKSDYVAWCVNGYIKEVINLTI